MTYKQHAKINNSDQSFLGELFKNIEEVERGVLGLIISENLDFGEVNAVLEANDFYTETHSLIFEAMKDLYNREEPISNLTLNDELRNTPRPNGEEWINYLLNLSEGYEATAVMGNPAYYIQRIKEESKIREIKKLGLRLSNADNRETIEHLKHEVSSIQFSDKSPAAKAEINYPQPLDEAAYYGLVGEIVKTIEPHSEADPMALLMNLLIAYGNVIGDKAYFKIGAKQHHFNMFAVFVGDTAKGRKGDSWPPIEVLFKAIEEEWTENQIQPGLSSGEGLIWRVRDKTFKRKLNNDSGDIENVLDGEGVSDKRLLVMEGEFAQTLKVLSRETNTLSPVIRNAWDSGILQTLTKNSPAKATAAHISIIGHITKKELIRALNEIETGNGFANRFLWLCVRRSKVLPFSGKFESVNLKSLTEKLSRAVDFARQAGEINWAQDSRLLWASIYPELSEGKPGTIGAITARAEALVTRLACIYALLDRSMGIKPPHLRAALAVWSYAEASVRYIFQNSASDPLANKILDALTARPDGMTRTDINKLLKGHYLSSRITDALDELVGAGLVDARKDETGGRPSERWLLAKDRCGKS